MYAKSKYQKYKHIATALLYVAILLAEGGELFVSHQPDSHNPLKTHHESSAEIEIPEHIPEKSGERLKAFKLCLIKSKQKDNQNHCVYLLTIHNDEVAAELLEKKEEKPGINFLV